MLETVSIKNGKVLEVISEWTRWRFRISEHGFITVQFQFQNVSSVYVQMWINIHSLFYCYLLVYIFDSAYNKEVT